VHTDELWTVVPTQRKLKEGAGPAPSDFWNKDFNRKERSRPPNRNALRPIFLLGQDVCRVVTGSVKACRDFYQSPLMQLPGYFEAGRVECDIHWRMI
jgi:hypothetical protein